MSKFIVPLYYLNKVTLNSVKGRNNYFALVGDILLGSFVFMYKPADRVLIDNPIKLNELPKVQELVLYNVILNYSLDMRKYDKLEIQGTCEIIVEDNDSCIFTKDAKFTLYGYGNLSLECGKRSTCIGDKIQLGDPLSKHDLLKLVVDSIKVKFISATNNFSIGSYGNRTQPVIELINKGKVIDCPEDEGKRILNNSSDVIRSNGNVDPIYSLEKTKKSISGVLSNLFSLSGK